jgi:hypothetical protein
MLCAAYAELLRVPQRSSPNACICGTPVRLQVQRLMSLADECALQAAVATSMVRNTTSWVLGLRPDFLLLVSAMDSAVSFNALLDWDRRLRNSYNAVYGVGTIPPRFWLVIIPNTFGASLSTLTAGSMDLKADIGNALDPLPFDERPQTTVVLKNGNRLYARRLLTVTKRVLHYALLHHQQHPVCLNVYTDDVNVSNQ